MDAEKTGALWASGAPNTQEASENAFNDFAGVAATCSPAEAVLSVADEPAAQSDPSLNIKRASLALTLFEDEQCTRQCIAHLQEAVLELLMNSFRGEGAALFCPPAFGLPQGCPAPVPLPPRPQGQGEGGCAPWLPLLQGPRAMRSKSGNVGVQLALHPAGQGRHGGRPANVAAGPSEEPLEEWPPASPTATAKGLFCWGGGDHNHPLPAQHGADARLMLAAPYRGGWAPVKADPGRGGA